MALRLRRSRTKRLPKRCFVLRCHRVAPLYRYVPAAVIACVIFVAHLLIQHTFLPAQTTNTVTAVFHGPLPVTDDDSVTSTSLRSSTVFEVHDLDWSVGDFSGTDCDAATTSMLDGSNDMVRYRFNCSNIERIRLRHKIGHGVSKSVYLGHSIDYDGGTTRHSVVVKMVTRKSLDVISCLRRLPVDANAAGRQRCFLPTNMKLMKEILLLNQLRHRGLLPLLGYCVRSEETESTSLEDHGVLAVYEYATHFYATSMADWSIDRRLDAAMQLANLATYFQLSPLGSLRIADFKETHFLLMDGARRIVMTDLDDVTAAEPSCGSSQFLASTNVSQHPNTQSCLYGLQCVGGECQGFNAIHNLDHFNHKFFRYLLHTDDAGRWINGINVDCCKILLATTCNQLNAFNLSASQLEKRLCAAQRCCTSV